MYISIIGDSISTFQGSNPKGYRVFYEGYKARINGMDSVDKTWWYQVIDRLNGELCVNNAYSGSRVSGQKFPASNSMQRIRELGDKTDPDLILAYIGMNDFGYCVPVGKVRLFRIRMTPDVFYDAYSLMLVRMKQQYPKAQIICATLMETHVKQDDAWHFAMGFPRSLPLEQYNHAIRFACRKNRVNCADLHLRAEMNGGMTYETLDGVHPTSVGHRTLADCWMQELKGVLR